MKECRSIGGEVLAVGVAIQAYLRQNSMVAIECQSPEVNTIRSYVVKDLLGNLSSMAVQKASAEV